MGKLYDRLKEDVRFLHGLHSCISCGTCTAICPAASFWDYDPRELTELLQNEDDNILEELLQGERIWYCGQCMSCKTRCPRDNTPGLIIQALRNLSIDTGFYMHSARGRQMYVLKKMIGETILSTGYCVHADRIDTTMFPEQGPVWDWIRKNSDEIYNRFGNSYNRSGTGALRKIPDEALAELNEIFRVTGSLDRFDQIENDAEEYAKDHQFDFDTTIVNEYCQHLYTTTGDDGENR